MSRTLGREHVSKTMEQPTRTYGERGRLWDIIELGGSFAVADSRSASAYRPTKTRCCPYTKVQVQRLKKPYTVGPDPEETSCARHIRMPTSWYWTYKKRTAIMEECGSKGPCFRRSLSTWRSS